MDDKKGKTYDIKETDVTGYNNDVLKVKLPIKHIFK